MNASPDRLGPASRRVARLLNAGTSRGRGPFVLWLVGGVSSALVLAVLNDPVSLVATVPVTLLPSVAWQWRRIRLSDRDGLLGSWEQINALSTARNTMVLVLSGIFFVVSLLGDQVFVPDSETILKNTIVFPAVLLGVFGGIAVLGLSNVIAVRSARLVHERN